MSLLPSEIARLVLGYLEAEKCKRLAELFLETSPRLQECRLEIANGKAVDTTMGGMALTDFMEKFCELSNAGVRSRNMGEAEDATESAQDGKRGQELLTRLQERELAADSAGGNQPECKMKKSSAKRSRVAKGKQRDAERRTDDYLSDQENPVSLPTRSKSLPSTSRFIPIVPKYSLNDKSTQDFVETLYLKTVNVAHKVTSLVTCATTTTTTTTATTATTETTTTLPSTTMAIATNTVTMPGPASEPSQNEAVDERDRAKERNAIPCSNEKGRENSDDGNIQDSVGLLGFGLSCIKFNYSGGTETETETENENESCPVNRQAPEEGKQQEKKVGGEERIGKGKRKGKGKKGKGKAGVKPQLAKLRLDAHLRKGPLIAQEKNRRGTRRKIRDSARKLVCAKRIKLSKRENENENENEKENENETRNYV